jgi:hypothetical protein
MYLFLSFCDCQILLCIVDAVEYVASLLHIQSIVHICGGLHIMFQILQQSDE